MINWIKKFFVIEDKAKKRSKCSSCGLGATKYMLIEFQTLELIEIKEKNPEFSKALDDHQKAVDKMKKALDKQKFKPTSL